MKTKGFTLIELLVVVAIISLISSVAMASLTVARQKARDSKRFTDLEALQKAIEFYASEKGYYPKESEGANGKVGEGAGLDSMIAPYIQGSVPKDPRAGSGSSYYYYYDGRQLCDGRYVAVIFARNLEIKDGSTSRTACASWGGEGGAGASNSYMIVLGPSDG